MIGSGPVEEGIGREGMRQSHRRSNGTPEGIEQVQVMGRGEVEESRVAIPIHVLDRGQDMVVLEQGTHQTMGLALDGTHQRCLARVIHIVCSDPLPSSDVFHQLGLSEATGQQQRIVAFLVSDVQRARVLLKANEVTLPDDLPKTFVLK